MLFSKKIIEYKYDIIAYLLVSISILLVTFYISSSYWKLRINAYEKELQDVGVHYVSNINSGLNKYLAAADMMTLSFIRNVDNDNFLSDTKTMLKTTMAKYPNVKLVNLVLNAANVKFYDVFVDDSTQLYQLSMTQKDNNALNVQSQYENEDSDLKRKISSLTHKRQTQVLQAENIMINNKFSTVYPVVSVMYKGNFFLGYVVLYVDANLNKNNSEFDDYEIFAFSKSDKLASSNVGTALLGDKMSKVCKSCKSDYTEAYSMVANDKILTVCFNHGFNNNKTEWNVCVRGNISLLKLKNKILTIWGLGIACIMIAVLSIYLITRKYRQLWARTNLAIDKLVRGDIGIEELSDLSSKEQKTLKNSIAEVDTTFRTIISNNNKILSGNLQDIQPINKFNKKINNSHTQLYDKFIEINSELIDRNNELKEIKQIDKNLDIISELIQKNNSDVELMVDKFIQKIVNLLDFEMGAVFFKTNRNNVVYLEQAVSYAYNENKKNKLRFELGDSLVGACATEKRVVLLRKIPKNYLKIISGLGDAPPKNILLVPLLFENETLGVIELGSLHDIDDKTIKFVEKVAADIAVVLSLTQDNARNQRQVIRHKNESKILLAQNKTIKEQLKELQSIHDETIRNEAILKSRLNSISSVVILAEYNPDGILIDTNFKFNNTFLYSRAEIINQSVEKLIAKKDKNKVDEILHNIKQDKSYESVIYMRDKKSIEHKVYSIYSPILDEKGNIKSILFFGVRISDLDIR